MKKNVDECYNHVVEKKKINYLRHNINRQTENIYFTKKFRTLKNNILGLINKRPLFHIQGQTLMSYSTHREIFLNFINLTQIWIVITFFRQIQHQLELRLVQNISEKGNYNPNLVNPNQIWIVKKLFRQIQHQS